MMITQKNLGFDLNEIAEAFDIESIDDCVDMKKWLDASYTLSPLETQIINDLYDEISTFGDYMNEEELKTKMVGLLFYVAKIEIPKKVKVFYERPLSGIVNNISLSVICDCIVATPSISAPKKPYFFLQELKKARGENRNDEPFDSEGQMLVAMLIAQQKNNDGQVIYGGYLIGTGWHFTTLIENKYCVSRKYEATNKQDLLSIVFILRKLKELIVQRIF
jgi:hypothetical protein